MINEDKEDSEKFEKLRREAEKKLEEAVDSSEGLSKEEAPPIKELLHELQVHQVELEMQNEKLRETRARLQKAKDKYSDLYDFAPVSYLTLNEEGEILDANLTAAKKLRTERDQLREEDLYKYVEEEDRDILYKHLRKAFREKSERSCELKVVPSPDGSTPESGESA
ncbi:PAS domain-containing protein, partial [Candidatus Bipolaricaulota bacterium]|nr:PAS domain-containing protein [Candidatus Bipolaricaulota bacterium]